MLTKAKGLRRFVYLFVILFQMNCFAGLWPFKGRGCEVFDVDGKKRPLKEVLVKQPNLAKVLEANPWAQNYAATLKTIGDKVHWEVSQDGTKIIGSGVWTPSIGPIRMVIDKNAPLVQLNQGSPLPLESYVEIYVDPSKLENSKEITTEAGAAVRREFQLDAYPQFLVSTNKTPEAEGPYQGLHKMTIPFNVIAKKVENSSGTVHASLLVWKAQENPSVGIIAESFLRNLQVASMFKPLQ